MTQEVAQQVKAFLDSSDCVYELIHHEPYSNSQEATELTGIQPDNAAKALLYSSTGQFVLAVLPASEKASSSKIKRLLNTKDLRFASSEQLKDVMNCSPGSCHPLGRIAGIRTIADESLLSREYIGFSTGDPSQTIIMSPQMYIAAARPEIAGILQDPVAE